MSSAHEQSDLPDANKQQVSISFSNQSKASPPKKSVISIYPSFDSKDSPQSGTQKGSGFKMTKPTGKTSSGKSKRQNWIQRKSMLPNVDDDDQEMFKNIINDLEDIEEVDKRQENPVTSILNL